MCNLYLYICTVKREKLLFLTGPYYVNYFKVKNFKLFIKVKMKVKLTNTLS